MATAIGLFIALIIGIITGVDAKTRGMSAWGWGIFVFLIMILVLPIYLITRKPKIEIISKPKGKHDTAEQVVMIIGLILVGLVFLFLLL